MGTCHQYKIQVGQRTVPHGFSGSMQYDRTAKKWVFNLNGMFGDIRNATTTASKNIMKQDLKVRNRYATFIYKHGFFYTNN